MDADDGPVETELSERYQDADGARRYANKHRRSWKLRLRDRAEQRLCARAFARIGHVARILDVPAGAGRFWPVLDRSCDELHAVEPSRAMLDAGKALHPEIALAGEYVDRIEDVDLPDARFDVVFCSRLMHHFADEAKRVEVLTRLANLSSRHVIFSTWVTGNLGHRRSQRRNRPDPDRIYVPVSQLHAEAGRAGLEIVRVSYKLRVVSPLVLVEARKVSRDG